MSWRKGFGVTESERAVRRTRRGRARRRAGWTSGVLVGLLLLAACGDGAESDDEASDAPPGVAQPDLILTSPEGNVPVPGDESWRVETGVTDTSGYRVRAAGDWFLVAGVDPDDTDVTRGVLGETASGDVLREFRFENASGWPALAVVEGDPVVTMATRAVSPDEYDRVSAFSADGSLIWSRSGERIGQRSTTSTLIVDHMDSGRVVLRDVPQERSQFREAGIMVLDTSAGHVEWNPKGPDYRAILVDRDVLLANYRSDGRTDEIADRVRAWRLDTGYRMFDQAVLNERPTINLCATVLSRTRIMLCGSELQDLPDGGTAWVNDVTVVDQEGNRIWDREGLSSGPALDPQTRTMVLVDSSGSLQGVAAKTGEPRWSWSSRSTTDAQIDVDIGYRGWVVGNTGPSGVILDAEGGQVVLVDDLFSINTHQLTDDVYLAVRGADLVGMTGASPPVGIDRDAPLGVLYLAEE